MRVFGIDPGSVRTGFACIESDGRRHQLVDAGAIVPGSRAAFPVKLHAIHRALAERITASKPDCIVVESLFHAANARSALQLGHARGVALLAAVEAGVPIVEYTPAEVKRAVVGYGRAEKGQVQRMVQLLLGLDRQPSPHDVADAMAIAICHLHRGTGPAAVRRRQAARAGAPQSWRQYRPGASR